jgi:hypothetical protein
MKRLLVFVSVLLLFQNFAVSRENPFVPAVEQSQMPVTSSDPQIKESLDSQQIQLPQGAKILNTVTMHYQDSSGEIKTKEYTVDKKVDWHFPLVLRQTRGKQTTKNYKLGDLVSITQEGYTALVRTEDMVIRDFHLSDPFKIVLDFRSKQAFGTKTVSMQKPFEKAVMGSHRGYYRVVLQMDAVYEYSLRKTDGGVRIELK